MLHKMGHGSKFCPTTYFSTELGRFALGNNAREIRINNLVHFCKLFSEDFKAHKALFDISTRQKKSTESTTTYHSLKNQDENHFIDKNAQAIEDLNRILPLIIFSECAAFNPHLILGRGIFSSCVDAKQKSISKEILSNIIHSPLGSIHNGFGSGLINWVTHEELQLLWLDKENLNATGEDAKTYFMEFIQFIEIAIDNGLGFISGTNLNVSLLKMIENPKLKIEIDLTKMRFEYIIRYE
jgi:hypothetical protein